MPRMAFETSSTWWARCLGLCLLVEGQTWWLA